MGASKLATNFFAPTDMAFLLLLQLAALNSALARRNGPVKPLRTSLRLGLFSKRGGATKTSLSLRGAGFRAYEKRTVARVPRGGSVSGGTVDAYAPQQLRPQDDAAVDLNEVHDRAALATRGGQLPLLVLRLVRILPRLLAILVPALGGYSNLEKFDLLGTALFAYVGTIAGGKNGMDVFGCMVIGTVTATGGGTLRDIVLGGEQQVFWMRDVTYLKICIVTSLVTFFTWPRFETKRGWRDDHELLCFADALGMGAFCVMGAEKALVKDVDPLCAAILGLVTATFGGVTRDVLTRRPVRIFHATIDGAEKSWYALPALFGSSVYVFLQTCCEVDKDLAAVCAFLMTVTMRVAAYTYRLTLPAYPNPEWQDGRRVR